MMICKLGPWSVKDHGVIPTKIRDFDLVYESVERDVVLRLSHSCSKYGFVMVNS